MPFQVFIENAGFKEIVPLDEGASAFAFKAYDPVLQRDVFIKYYSTFPGADERILSEPRKIASLFGDAGNAADHIVSLYSTREVDDGTQKYIEMVTEFCEGNSLYKKVRQDDVYVLDALDYAKQAIDGLHVLHRKRFVHRDIKPSNLVLRANKIKIIDLGATAEIAAGEDALISRSKHSIFYRPPESFDPHNLYSLVSDIYQIGLVLYELINGPIIEDPNHYLERSIVRKEENRIKKIYAEMHDADQSLIQDESIGVLAKRGGLLERAAKPRRLYTRELRRIVVGLSAPNTASRVKSCAEARILLSSYSGADWCEKRDGSIHVRNFKGRDYLAKEWVNKSGNVVFECLSSVPGTDQYRKLGKVKCWDDFQKMLEE